jgi:guanylate kinase
VSYTTRPQRPGEQDGIDYHFVTRNVFDAMVAQGAFAEWAEVHGNRYGTAIETLERFRSEGRNILLDIDCQGARQLKKSYRQGVFIFVLPPSLTELHRRLNGAHGCSESLPGALPMPAMKSEKLCGMIISS